MKSILHPKLALRIILETLFSDTLLKITSFSCYIPLLGYLANLKQLKCFVSSVCRVFIHWFIIHDHSFIQAIGLLHNLSREQLKSKPTPIYILETLLTHIKKPYTFCSPIRHLSDIQVRWAARASFLYLSPLPKATRNHSQKRPMKIFTYLAWRFIKFAKTFRCYILCPMEVAIIVVL